jgi:hypothetical protein
MWVNLLLSTVSTHANETSILNVDMSQDCGRNPFTKKMRPVYKVCAEDKGTGVTKRSIGRTGDVLSDEGPTSPFACLVRGTSKRLRSDDETLIGATLKKFVSDILDQVYETVNGALIEKIEDEAELAARADLQQFLPTLLAARDQVDQDLQAVMTRYGLQTQPEQLVNPA